MHRDTAFGDVCEIWGYCTLIVVHYLRIYQSAILKNPTASCFYSCRNHEHRPSYCVATAGQFKQTGRITIFTFPRKLYYFQFPSVWLRNGPNCQPSHRHVDYHSTKKINYDSLPANNCVDCIFFPILLHLSYKWRQSCVRGDWHLIHDGPISC